MDVFFFWDFACFGDDDSFGDPMDDTDPMGLPVCGSCSARIEIEWPGSDSGSKEFGLEMLVKQGVRKLGV